VHAKIEAKHKSIDIFVYKTNITNEAPSVLTSKVKTMTTPMPKFELYKDAAGKFRWRLKAPNGEIIGMSEAYESKDGCKNGINSVKTNAPKAEIVDMAM